MATRTVVCPDCGAAAAAPGRYACSECGALLASVAVTPRGWSATEGGESPDHATAMNDATAPDDAAELAAATAQAEPDDEPRHAEAAPDPEWPDPAVARGAVTARRPSGAVRRPSGTLAFDDDAPLGSAGTANDPVEPDVLHDPAGPDVSPIDPGRAPELETVAASLATALAAPAPDAPAWPPAGDHGAIDRAVPRTPAGAYLPPSAVLPPLDGGGEPADPGAASGSAAAASGASAAAQPDGRTDVGTWASRASTALGDALDGIEIPADGSRRAVGVGAGIGALGLLLPWVNGPANEGALAGYLDRWGLAGPGMWLVFLGIVALAAVAASSGRAASWPVGLPAIALACFLGGVLWPYLLGGFGRSIGVWVVLAGAIVLVVGGVLDRGDRHAGAEPAVSTGVSGGR